MIELAGLDRAGALQQPSHRTGHSGADQHREYQTKNRGKQGQNCGDRHDLSLLACRQLCVSTQQRKHVRPDGVHLLIHLVAQGVHAGKAVIDHLVVTGIEKG